MAPVHGKSTKVYTNGYDLTGYLNKAVSGAQSDKPESTVFGKNSKTYDPGLLDGTLVTEGFFVANAQGDTGKHIHEVIRDALNAQGGVWTHLPAGDALGKPACCGYGVETDYEIDNAPGDLIKLKVTGQSSVGVKFGEVLHALAAEVATGNGTTQDDGATIGATAFGGDAFLHVTALAGATPGGTVKVQHSVDGTTWVDLCTFTLATAIGAQHVALTAGATVNRYLRAVHTLQGGTTSFTYHLAFARNRSADQ